MSSRWTKFILVGLLLVSMVGGYPPTHAQTLPTLPNLASDPSGAVTVFYPAGWQLEVGAEGETILSEQGLAAGKQQILISLLSQSIEPPPLDEMPDWLIETGYVPETAFFSLETYNGEEVWLAQGDGLFAEGIYSALAVVLVKADEIVVLQSDFPSSQLAEAAPLVSSILDSLVLLPFQTLNEAGTLSIRLPEGWIYTDQPTGFIAAPTSEDWQTLTEGGLPLEVGLRVDYQVGDFTLEELRTTTTAVLADSRNLLTNNVPTVLDLRQDFTTASTEILLLRQRAGDAFLELWAVSSDTETLLTALPTLQAIFGSVQVQSAR